MGVEVFVKFVINIIIYLGGGGEGRYSLRQAMNYVRLQRIGFLGLWGRKTGIYFVHFGVE